jgi:predicted AlkP superfamily pyrophosphatase or phosphodiesterase
MNRRIFLLSALNAAYPRRGRAAALRKIVVALLDGFGPDYLEKSDMPTLKKIAGGGEPKPLNA